MQNLLIHIGIQKTGTTWLQRELFISSHPLFEPLSRASSGQSSLASKFVVGDDGYILSPFETNKVSIERELLNILKTKKSIKDKVFVLSSERLSGHPHSGGFDAKTIANRLKVFFKDAKILLVIREQKAFLLSNYFEYLKFGGTHHIINYLNIQYDRKRPFFSPHHINYLPLVWEYIQLFGKENVLVLPYELFKTNPERFIAKIGNLIDKEIEVDQKKFNLFHNQQSKQFIQYYGRKLNYLTKSNSLNNYSSLKIEWISRMILFMLNRVNYFIPKSWNTRLTRQIYTSIENWVQDRYVLDNAALSKVIGIDLSKFNYH